MGRSFVLIAIALVGCRPTPPAPPPTLEAALVGQRELLGHEPPFVPAFDRQRLPTVRLTATTRLSARWIDADGEPHPLSPGAPMAVGAEVLVRLSPPVAPPLGPGTVEVEAAGGRRAAWPARWAVPPMDRPGRGAIRALWKAKPPDYAAARAGLVTFGDAPVDRAWARAEEARIAAREGRTEDGVAGAVAAAELYAAAGHPSFAAARHLLAARYATLAHHLTMATGHADTGCTLAATIGDAENRGRCLRRRATLERETGRLRAAERLLEEAERITARAALPSLLHHVRHSRANLLRQMGRHAEAAALFDALAQARPTDITLANNRAWARLVAMRVGAMPPDYADLAAHFAGLIARLPPGPDPGLREELYANRATASLLAGQLDDAEAALTAVRAWGYDVAYARLLDGEMALARADLTSAAAAFDDARRRAQAMSGLADSSEAWWALYGLGRVARARGDTTAAVEHWQAARAMADRMARWVALSSGQSTFLADRRGLVTDAVQLLVQSGRVAEAFRFADRARAPTLRALATRSRVGGLAAADRAAWRAHVERWYQARRAVADAVAQADVAPTDARPAALRRLEAAQRHAQDRFDDAFAWLDERAPAQSIDPGDPLTLVPAGMALVTYDRLGSTWHGFLIAGGVVDHRVLTSEADVLPDAWRARLAGVDRLYVVDGGLPAARGLSARPVRAGGPAWGEQIELVYLPYAAWLRSTGQPATGPPVVVADPDGTLPDSRRAAVAVARRAGVDPLVGAEASRDAVLAALDGAAWVHFDGHGALGRGQPWQARLVLAGGETLTLAEVLAHRPQVGTVVLSGCETGAPEALSRSEGLGLAEGFVLAGAGAVLAADRELDAQDAARFVEVFYGHGGPTRPAAALRESIAALRARGDDAWRGWRLFGARPTR